jgi:NADH pyrophosphatase NudC (nudix superfamily)
MAQPAMAPPIAQHWRNPRQLASAVLLHRTMQASAQDRLTTTTTTASFYRETKWCGTCAAQVRYIASVDHSYCVECGGRVRLFAPEQRAAVAEAAKLHRYQAV